MTGYWEDDLGRKILAENQKFYNRRLNDLDALIEELWRERDKELLQDDAQGPKGAPSRNTPPEQGCFNVVDGPKGDEKDTPI